MGINSDEIVHFFPTSCVVEPGTKTVSIPVHGWIYEPEEGSLRRRAFLGALRRALGLTKDDAGSKLFAKRAIISLELSMILSCRMGLC